MRAQVLIFSYSLGLQAVAVPLAPGLLQDWSAATAATAAAAAEVAVVFAGIA